LFGPSPILDLSSKSAAPAGSGWRYDADEDAFYIEAGGDVKVTNATQSARIIVEAGDSTITLENARIDHSANDYDWVNQHPIEGYYIWDDKYLYTPICLKPGASLTVRLSGENTFKGGFGAAAIDASAGTALVITSSEGDGETSGKLTAEAGLGGAGIGGTYFSSGGSILIKGGTIRAVGNYTGAGVGGGEHGDGGSITIEGGVVVAEGGDFAAGLGGGAEGEGGLITITGGYIAAVCAHPGIGTGAGIGGGEYGDSGTVKINYPSGNSYGYAQVIRNPGYCVSNPARAVGPGWDGSSGEFYDKDGLKAFPEGTTYAW
jgi:hypothetical protein